MKMFQRKLFNRPGKGSTPILVAIPSDSESPASIPSPSISSTVATNHDIDSPPTMSVSIHPTDHLVLNRPFTQDARTELDITNSSDRAITYKIKTTAPRAYHVRPNPGRVEPGETVSVRVTLLAMKEQPPVDARCKDKFLVQYALIPQEEGRVPLSLHEMWANEKLEKSCEMQKLRVVYSSEAREERNYVNGQMPGYSRFETVREMPLPTNDFYAELLGNVVPARNHTLPAHQLYNVPPPYVPVESSARHAPKVPVPVPPYESALRNVYLSSHRSQRRLSWMILSTPVVSGLRPREIEEHRDSVSSMVELGVASGIEEDEGGASSRQLAVDWVVLVVDDAQVFWTIATCTGSFRFPSPLVHWGAHV
ncbi:phosphatidylinositol-binding protein scs2 [Steccherinum ochraceum]|uniref:Phosphatidylinositol-binding protein scs2 n=1 Tax=Steccherinum ochraceum TaxID=92696 RepID=A0A4R0R8A9_9APHY|nr:phosphatidylinositol-binding protein scs2 [Steccherinum ochraceum]